MIRMTLADVAAAVHGVLNDVANPAAVVTGAVRIDSRKVEPGDLFLAINGERVDGHDFAAAAVAAGALAVVTERSLEGIPCVIAGASADSLYGVIGSIGVDQPTIVALADLAREVRKRLTHVRVLAMTGSSGKTSTKDLLAQILAHNGPTVAPVGSQNNEIGFPLTVLSADETTRYLVLEMGAREVGHIAYLCSIAQPDVSMALNVGLAHVGIFGSPDAVAHAKSEIVSGLPAHGIAVLNADDERTRGMASLAPGRVVLFGEAPDADVRADNIVIDELARATFTLSAPGLRDRDVDSPDASVPNASVPDASVPESATVTLQVSGEHQVSNALAAATSGLLVGMTLAEVAEALSQATARSPMRMDVSTTPDGVLLIDDAYNANPNSMRAALKALVAMGKGRRTFAVLGEMLELGDRRIAEHDDIGRLAVRLNVGQVVAVGDGARVLHLGAANEGSWDQESTWVPDPTAAIEYLRARLEPGDVVLVKASRSIGLEVICDALRRPGFTAAAESSRETESPRTESRETESQDMDLPSQRQGAEHRDGSAPQNLSGERGAPA